MTDDRVFHLAQYNVALARTELDDPVMEGFVEQLEAVNALGEQSEGFVWRFETEDGDATAIRPYGDPLALINMTVWESIETFQAFVYRGLHGEVFRQRSDWFRRSEQPTLVLWWVPAGEVPTVEEGMRRLEMLRQRGASEEAFTLQERFESPAIAKVIG